MNPIESPAFRTPIDRCWSVSRIKASRKQKDEKEKLRDGGCFTCCIWFLPVQERHILHSWIERGKYIRYLEIHLCVLVPISYPAIGHHSHNLPTSTSWKYLCSDSCCPTQLLLLSPVEYSFISDSLQQLCPFLIFLPSRGCLAWLQFFYQLAYYHTRNQKFCHRFICTLFWVCLQVAGYWGHLSWGAFYLRATCKQQHLQSFSFRGHLGGKPLTIFCTSSHRIPIFNDFSPFAVSLWLRPTHHL